MMVPYALRLLCICLAAFFLVNAFFGLLVSLATRGAIRVARKMEPRSAARFLLFLRLVPAGAGLAVVLALCIPSYLWLEPQSAPERVGAMCFSLVFVSLASVAAAFARGARASFASLRFRWTWKRSSRPANLPGDRSNARIVEKEAPLLALAGVVRPQLFISSSVLQALTSKELEVALRHENAHRFSRDNVKRLLFLLTPLSFPFLRGFALLERAWAELSEWAADDEAVQGDENRAVALASALLQVARLGAGPRLSFLHTSLVPGDLDLSARVNRLLHLERLREEPVRKGKYLAPAGFFGVAICTLLVASGPAALSSIHRLLELVVQ